MPSLVERVPALSIQARHSAFSGHCAPVVGLECKRKALLHFVAAASGAFASTVAFRPSKPRAARLQMETAMGVFSTNELWNLTRDELCDLAERLERALAKLEAGSPARTSVLTSLTNIRRVMTLRGLHF
jgi:hypothetical protein